ncbi:hypothetical protein SAMN04487911_12120 [Arenibacter nanhaiticus]|uniref:Flavodoxin-like domain-containing protein n=1 Tax=Arenibacter nanhaiticus TaxID=558155 RepID=A0A1M6JA61_9FLAO|nr:hypothetical protein [Arenibacter nanhaiticus]SHJ43563.1 hypothetical protein SAMN04487911_12120 [Arenibacter nanhaiticus]
MKAFNKIWPVIFSLLLLFLIFLMWYHNTYAMSEASEYDENSISLDSKLLIATQGSEFKNRLTQEVVAYYKMKEVYIKVIDVSSLERINPINYDAILLLHTWEYWKPPTEVKLYIERQQELLDRMVILTTSGKGTSKMKEVDAITGESILEDIPYYVNTITKKLDSLLGGNFVN